MPVYKRKYPSGTVSWFYKFSPPGAIRGSLSIRKFGFATKREAEDAEAQRRIDEQRNYESVTVDASSITPLPTTLGTLIERFISDHAQKKLAPKTVERYCQQALYLNPALLNMRLEEIKPLHLNSEWSRLLQSGGHTRGEKTPRPLSPKSVRNIAGLVSSAFLRGVKWGLVPTNPVCNSEPPVPKKRRGMALIPSEQRLVIQSATGPWCLPILLEISAATGARRGEVLALRWSDIQNGREAVIARSLCQTKQGLLFKGTKTEMPRTVELPESVLGPLEVHRRLQEKFRQQYGADYRADLDLVFANPDGTPLKPDSISASVSSLCRRLGLPKGVSLHTLRHTHGSFLLADGMDLATVSERLGHSSVRVTADIYSHALRGRDQEAARRWDRFMRQHEPREEHDAVN